MEVVYRPDFHTHTIASDGALGPEALVVKAKEAGINALSITDHDSFNGLKRAEQEARKLGMAFIPGVEISTAGEDEIHVLGYHVHDGMERVKSLILSMQSDRRARAPRFIEKLNQLGLAISLDDLQLHEGTECNRPAVAHALLRLGYVSSIQEAFERYLAQGRPAYVPRMKVSTAEVIAILRNDGAVPVLAHPGLIKSPRLRTQKMLRSYQEAGLMGIEAWHSKHSPAECKQWDQTARALGMLVTGGSDYHREHDRHGPLGCMLKHWKTASQDAANLLAFGPEHDR